MRTWWISTQEGLTGSSAWHVDNGAARVFTGMLSSQLGQISLFHVSNPFITVEEDLSDALKSMLVKIMLV